MVIQFGKSLLWGGSKAKACHYVQEPFKKESKFRVQQSDLLLYQQIIDL